MTMGNSPSLTLRPEPPLAQDDRVRFLRLLRRTLGKGFTAAVVATPAGDALPRLVDWLNAEIAPAKGRLVLVDVSRLRGGSLSDAVRQAVESQPSSPHLALLIHGFENARSQAERQNREGVFRQLNVQRDLLRQVAPCFWTLLIHPATLQLLRSVAPDFCDFVSVWGTDSAETTVPSAPAPQSPSPSQSNVSASFLSSARDAVVHPLLADAIEKFYFWDLDRGRDDLGRFEVSRKEHSFEAERNVVDGLLRLREGRTEEARELLQAVIDQLSKRYAEDTSIQVSKLYGLALVILVEVQFILGNRKDAEGLARHAIEVYQRIGDRGGQAESYGRLADVLQERGQLDEVLRIRREEELPVFERLGDVRAKAITMGKIADVLQQRGQTDEALWIFKEQVLPAFERLGDVRAKAVTMARIADVHQQRGQLDEALRIRREEELPVFERLGDVRAKAITMGKIADVLQGRGQTDEALRIRLEEQLPVYDRLGDVRAKAVTMGKIADILQQRGQLDEALHLRREEELPVYERLGDVRAKIFCRAKIGWELIRRGRIQDHTEARAHLQWALAEAQRLQLPEATSIQEILYSAGTE